MVTKDTIAAISTPPGVGGIGIVRLSGPESVAILKKIFSNKQFIKHNPCTFVHGFIYDKDGSTIDRVMAVRFQAPHSYTGQDVVEIHCHGGLYIVQTILDTACHYGARLAEPGEFTKRAFLNNRIDLLQAESIGDLINAQTKSSHQVFIRQFQGKLSNNLEKLKNVLRQQCGFIELELDFSEDIQFTKRDELLFNIQSSLKEIDKLLASFHYGRIIRNGVHTVIVGEPNVGKSSILNRLLEYDRAIVTDIPGTTRDKLEESLDIKGVLFKITDTAGIWNTEDPVEKIGINLAMHMISNADIVLYVFHIQNHRIAAYDEKQFKKIADKVLENNKTLFNVVNKIDLPLSDQFKNFKIDSRFEQINISAKTGEGFDLLEEKLYEYVMLEKHETESFIITKLRHKKALDKTAEYLLHAESSIKKNLSAEFIALDLNNALESLGEITGEVTREEILNDIFDAFCIGK